MRLTFWAQVPKVTDKNKLDVPEGVQTFVDVNLFKAFKSLNQNGIRNNHLINFYTLQLEYFHRIKKT